MRLHLPSTAVLVFLSTVAVAEAANPTLLAETGAFLLGNALRCDVPADRVQRASKIIRDMIAAASQNTSEEKVAHARFSDLFLANAYPAANGNAWIPPCTVVVTQFERLEQHHQQAGLN
jgi:hypothetical protein